MTAVLSMHAGHICTSSELLFNCHALYLPRVMEDVGVTSVAGFGWTL
jgi:hypothetical protein